MTPYSRFDYLGHLRSCPCVLRTPPFTAMGMLITDWNQYPVQRRTPLESVRWEVLSHQLVIEIFNSWSVSPFIRNPIIACLGILKGSWTECCFLKASFLNLTTECNITNRNQ